MAAATTSTTVPATMPETATRPRARLARIHLVLLAVLAIVTWLALTVVVATRHGEERRATFNGHVQR